MSELRPKCHHLHIKYVQLQNKQPALAPLTGCHDDETRHERRLDGVETQRVDLLGVVEERVAEAAEGIGSRQTLVDDVLAEAMGLGVVEVQRRHETHHLDPAEAEDDVLVVGVDDRETCNITHIINGLVWSV